MIISIKTEVFSDHSNFVAHFFCGGRGRGGGRGGALILNMMFPKRLKQSKKLTIFCR